MDFTPDALLDAVPPIPSHALLAFVAFGLGLAQLLLPKGTMRHRIVGWGFVLAMGYVAISALFISEMKTFGYFSPIHILVPVTLVAIVGGVRDACRGDVRGHARNMVSLFVLAIVVTGTLTFLPGRIMHEVVFGPAPAVHDAAGDQTSERP